jgi:hypothetical protein
LRRRRARRRDGPRRRLGHQTCSPRTARARRGPRRSRPGARPPARLTNPCANRRASADPSPGPAPMIASALGSATRAAIEIHVPPRGCCRGWRRHERLLEPPTPFQSTAHTLRPRQIAAASASAERMLDSIRCNAQLALVWPCE